MAKPICKFKNSLNNERPKPISSLIRSFAHLLRTLLRRLHSALQSLTCTHARRTTIKNFIARRPNMFIHAWHGTFCVISVFVDSWCGDKIVTVPAQWPIAQRTALYSIFLAIADCLLFPLNASASAQRISIFAFRAAIKSCFSNF